MNNELERLKMIFSSQGGEALDKAIDKLPKDSSIRLELTEWRKTFQDD
jgi:hypothetical protein